MPAPSALVDAVAKQVAIKEQVPSRKKFLMALGSDDKAIVLQTLDSLTNGGEDLANFLKIEDTVANMLGHPDDVAAALNAPEASVRATAIETAGQFAGESQEVASLWGKDAMTAAYTASLGDAATRQAALRSVTIMGTRFPDVCVGALVACVGDKDSATRALAVTAVGAVGKKAFDGKEGVGKLSDFLKSESAGVRAAAAQAFALGGEAAAPYAESVAALLKDDAEDESSLTYQVGLHGRRQPSSMRRPKCAALSALARMGEDAFASKISEGLTDSNWEVRVCAAEALGLLGPKAKSETSALMQVLEDDAYPVRAMACSALGAIKDTDAVPRLIEAFEDSSCSVRANAVAALGEMGEAAEEYTHNVFKLLNDSVGFVKANACKTLAKLGEQGANYASVVATLLFDEDAEVRAAVLEALGNMGQEGAALADEISDFCDDPSPQVRQAAVAALETMGHQMTPMMKDWGSGRGVPVPVAAGESDLQGLGLYYKGIQQSKGELMASGQWIEGII